MIKTAFFLVGIFLSLAAAAQTGKPIGVWNGTLGSRSIVACFNGGDGSDSGSYYYKTFLKPIRLTTRSSENIWHEDDETGVWKLGKPANGAISGEWSSPKTNKTFPIRLQLVDGASDEAACARDSYNLPMEKLPSVETGKTIHISSGRAYRELWLAGQETVELIGVEAGLPKINSVLKPDQSAEAIKEYFQQRREFLGKVGFPAVDEKRINLKNWSGKLVTILFFNWPAGYGTNAIGMDYRTWNVDSGQEIDLWSWFGLERQRLSPAFEKLLLKKKVTKECLAGLQYKSFHLIVENNGFKFFSSGPSDDCPDELHIPYIKAVKLMTPQGQRQFDAIVGRK